MYKVAWDLDSGGILLVNSSKDEIIPPRPVFYEELDLLGFNKFWDYPKVEEPLLWNIGRRYYYKGKLVASVKGGGIFEKPKISLEDDCKNLSLEPVDVKLMVEKNLKNLETLENEAIDFIQDTFKRYKNKVDQVIVSYSGGKDSQVVLDLVSRTLPPDDYIVVFTDTTMEIPPTYEMYEKTKEYYTNIYPNLKFYVARNEKHSLELWKIFGPPSRILRWCCSVYKTSPQVRLIKALNPEKDKIKILTFEGVRADESARRGGYARIADEAKHIVQTNAEVIKYWNLSEVYLYLYKINIRDKEGKLIINKGYRYGLERVGCSICPFGSPWSELIIRQALPEHTNQYINIIEEYAKNLGIEDIQEYIAKGNWKKRAGGKGIYSNTHIFLLKESSSITAVIKNNNSSIKNRLEWFNVLDGFSYKNSENTIDGEMLIRNNLYKFRIDNNDGNSVIYVNNIKEEDNKIFTKLFNKATYCINCGACETECDSRALKVIPYVRIDRSLCKHCFKCLTFSPHGCILADSLNISMEGNTMKETQKIKINRYFTFGLRDEWLIPFLNNREEWFIKNNLGPDQLKAFIAWLQDAEILRNKSITSNVGERIIEIFKKDNILAFQIIWINLFYNSTIVSWYIKNIKWNSFISEREIKEMLKTYFSDSAERTLSNSVASLFNSFEKNSYISEKLRLGTVEKIGRERYVRKIGSNDIHPMAVLYSLYRYAISKNKYKLTVSELYREGNKDGGPYLIFGIERSALENILRWLQENKEELIRVNLTADLDNINLSEDITDYTKILEYY